MNQPSGGAGYDISASFAHSGAADLSGATSHTGGSKSNFPWQSAAIIGGAFFAVAFLVLKFFKGGK